MPSSTSNSDAPSGRWGLTAVVFVLASVALVGAAELWARSAGHNPLLQQNLRAFWAEQRGRVSGLDANGVVFVGASRIGRALNGPELEAQLGADGFVHLAIDGCFPGGTLEDLLQEADFKGVIVASIFVQEKEIDEHANPWHPCQQNFVDFYRDDWTPIKRAEWAIQKQIKLRSSLLSFSHWDLLPVLQGRGLQQKADEFRSDRVNPMNFRLPFWKEILEKRLAQKARELEGYAKTKGDDAAMARVLSRGRHLEPLIAAFQARGGRFVYLRTPTTNPYDNSVYADLKRRFWDELSKTTNAEVIHFLDVPEMQGFETPDGGHIDAADTPRFTKVLIEQLRSRGLLR